MLVNERFKVMTWELSLSREDSELDLTDASAQAECTARPSDFMGLMNVWKACESDRGRRQGSTEAFGLWIRNFSLQISLNSTDCCQGSG